MRSDRNKSILITAFCILVFALALATADAVTPQPLLATQTQTFCNAHLHQIENGESPQTEQQTEIELLEQEASPQTAILAIPLSADLQAELFAACADLDIPVNLALALIEIESNFDIYADNGQCYGLCQLNRSYFPDNLSPAQNIYAGLEYLTELIEQYSDISAALTAYNAGSDTGARGYANTVLAAAERW